MEKLLRRNKENRVFAGICSGLGDYSGMDPIIWRLIFIFGTVFTIFPFIVSYLIMWIVIPKKDAI